MNISIKYTWSTIPPHVQTVRGRGTHLTPNTPSSYTVTSRVSSYSRGLSSLKSNAAFHFGSRLFFMDFVCLLYPSKGEKSDVYFQYNTASSDNAKRVSLRALPSAYLETSQQPKGHWCQAL